MGYEPTNWKDGDLVTSAKLNKLEQGIANTSSGNFLIIHTTNDEQLDKTWQEIYDAMENGLVFHIHNRDNTKMAGLVTVCSTEEDFYIILVSSLDGNSTPFVTDSPNGYPTYYEPVIDNDDSPFIPGPGNDNTLLM